LRILKIKTSHVRGFSFGGANPPCT
jgi:hypothetical protein